MRHLLVVLIGLILFSSCGETEEHEPLPPILEEELREVMKMRLATGTGKVIRTLSYGGSSDRLFASKDIYYLAGDDINFQVIKDQLEDTVKIGLNYFQDGKIRTSHSFHFNGSRAEWEYTIDYKYDSEGTLIESYSTAVDKPRYLRARYIYDSQHRLTSIEYPFVNGVELQMYTYDEQGRVLNEWQTAKGQEEYKIGLLFCRYEDGFLVAKESGERGMPEGPRQDQFRYVYDQEGRLSVQYEFDPYFGFQQANRTEFFYD